MSGAMRPSDAWRAFVPSASATKNASRSSSPPCVPDSSTQPDQVRPVAREVRGEVVGRPADQQVGWHAVERVPDLACRRPPSRRSRRCAPVPNGGRNMALRPDQRRGDRRDQRDDHQRHPNQDRSPRDGMADEHALRRAIDAHWEATFRGMSSAGAAGSRRPDGEDVVDVVRACVAPRSRSGGPAARREPLRPVEGAHAICPRGSLGELPGSRPDVQLGPHRRERLDAVGTSPSRAGSRARPPPRQRQPEEVVGDDDRALVGIEAPERPLDLVAIDDERSRCRRRERRPWSQLDLDDPAAAPPQDRRGRNGR